MSLEAYSKIFFGPRAAPTPLEVKTPFLQPGKEIAPLSDSYQAGTGGLKKLNSGKKWQPRHLARPSFVLDKTDATKAGKKPGNYESAKAKYEKAEGEVEKAKAEYEKLRNGAKAFKDMGNSKQAQNFSAQAAVAKKHYEQKVLAAHVAKQQMEKCGAKLAKPSAPAKGMAPAGEELSGPTGLTLAKNHAALRGQAKGVA